MKSIAQWLIYKSDPKDLHLTQLALCLLLAPCFGNLFPFWFSYRLTAIGKLFNQSLAQY